MGHRLAPTQASVVAKATTRVILGLAKPAYTN
jgi:hypothetical protein